MKIIISHDVDHISAWEHSKDLIIPKFIARALIEWCFGYISTSEVKGRLLSVINNKWNQIEELMEFDSSNSIPSTFFIGVMNGCYLAYRKDIASKWIEKIRLKGFDVGVHGIAYNSFNNMFEEYKTFKKISSLDTFGIRMHYLRTTDNTFQNLARIGYVFDSSEKAMKNPYKIETMWEFPLHIMDGYIICRNQRWQNRKFKDIQHITINYLENAQRKGILYFTVLFHDRYFSDTFKTWKEWYIWFVTYCKELGMDFISYRDAILELDNLM